MFSFILVLFSGKPLCVGIGSESCQILLMLNQLELFVIVAACGTHNLSIHPFEGSTRDKINSTFSFRTFSLKAEKGVEMAKRVWWKSWKKSAIKGFVKRQWKKFLVFILCIYTHFNMMAYTQCWLYHRKVSFKRRYEECGKLKHMYHVHLIYFLTGLKNPFLHGKSGIFSQPTASIFGFPSQLE